jgi:outer membrane protein
MRPSRHRLHLCTLLSCLILATGCARAFAESPLTPKALPPQPLGLEAAVAYGIEHNPSLQASAEEINAAVQGVKQAHADFLPKLDSSYASTHFKDAPFARIQALQFQTSHSDVNHWEAQVTQPLFTGFALSAQYKNAKLEREQAGLRREQLRLDLVSNIQHAFLQTLLAEKILQVQRDTILQLETHRRNAQAYFQQGLTPRNDVLKADVALADARQKEQIAAKQVRILRSQLNQLLDLELNTPLQLEEWTNTPDVTSQPRDLAGLYSKAEQQRPEYQALQTALRQTEEGRRLAQSRLYPHAALFASYYREGRDLLGSDNDFTNENNAAVGVKIDWNWFEGGKTYAAVKQARYRRLAVEERQRDLLQQIRVQVEDAHAQLEVSRTNLETARVAIEQAKENLRITQIQYQQQVVVFSEVLDAQVFLTQAQVNYYQALYGYQLAWGDLERAVGGTLSTVKAHADAPG